MNLAVQAPFATGLAMVIALVATGNMRSDMPAVPIVESLPATVEEPVMAQVVVASTPAPTEPCADLDLDGDGLADRFEEVPGSCGTGGCEFEVYIRDQLVGRVAGRCPLEVAPRAGTNQDILASWRLGANETQVTRYWFKAGHYRARSEFHCTGDACSAEHWIYR